jgi:hypothetical protein
VEQISVFSSVLDDKSKSPKFEARNDDGSKESEKGTPLAKKKSPIKLSDKLNDQQRSEMREAKREEREETDI